MAFEGARERLLAAAGRRKERYDQHVQDAPLPVGQLVYLRDRGARGLHKIQDLWSSVAHQVVRVPVGERAVYTVAPVDDLERTRNVHRDMLKAVVQPEAVASLPTGSSLLPSPPLVTSDDDSLSSDLWLLGSETSVLPPAAPQLAEIPDAALAPAASSSAVPVGNGGALQQTLSPAPSVASADQPSTSQQSLRRTTRGSLGLIQMSIIFLRKLVSRAVRPMEP